MDDAPRSFRFARNLSWNALGQVGGWAVSFMVTPYLIHRMGIEVYGLYLLLYLVSGYLVLLSFGTTFATTIKTAELLALKNRRGLRETFACAGIVNLIGLSAGAAVMIGAAPFCARAFFNVPAPLQDVAVLVLRCAAAGAIFVAFFQLGGAALQGMQRFDYYNVLSLVQAVLLPAGVALIFALGFGLAQASMWFVALNALTAAVALIVCRRLFSRIGGEEGPALPLRPFAHTSAGLWLAQCAWVVVYQADKLFVGRNLPLSDLTLYAVPAGVLMRLQSVPANIYSVVMPMVSELQGPSAEEDLSRMYLKSVRALLWAALPILILLFGLMPQFLTLWLGPEFGGKSVWPARWLVLGYAISLLDYMPRMVAFGRGKPLYPTVALWSHAAISVIAWIWLVPRYQILGAAIGFMAAQALTLPFFLWKVHGNVVRVPWERYLREGLRGPCVSAMLMLALVMSLHSRVDGWVLLAALSAAAVGLYYLSAWLMMSREDKDLARRYLRLA